MFMALCESSLLLERLISFICANLNLDFGIFVLVFAVKDLTDEPELRAY